MSLNADNIIYGANMKIWVKAFDAANAMPADTIAWGASISGFTELGYTEGGLGLAMGLESGEITADQSYVPLYTPIIGSSFVMSTELAEITPANLQRASSLGAIATVAAASGTRGHNALAVTNSLAASLFSVLFDIQQPNLEAFRVLGYKTQPTGSATMQFTKDDKATIAAEWTALADTSTDPARIGEVRQVTPALP